MKKSNIFVKLVLFVVVFGVLGGFGYYYFFLREENKTDGGILPSLSGKKVNDNKNGIYSYKVKNDRVKTLLKSCVVDAVYDHLVVINEDYYLYHGNCLNMLFVGQGKTENLKFEKSNDSQYSVVLNNITYKKDFTTPNIIVENGVLNNEIRVNYDVLKYIVDYSEYPGYYYSFGGSIPSKYNYKFDYGYNRDLNSFRLRIFNQNIEYVKNMNSFNDIPYFSLLNNNLIIIDKNKIGEWYKSELYLYTEEAKTYDYNSIFPINVNGNVIDSSWNRLFMYDNDTKAAYVVFSRSSDICDFNNNNYFYEFKMKYDYEKSGFKNPDLYKKGSTKKDCNYAKKKYLKEV